MGKIKELLEQNKGLTYLQKLIIILQAEGYKPCEIISILGVWPQNYYRAIKDMYHIDDNQKDDNQIDDKPDVDNQNDEHHIDDNQKDTVPEVHTEPERTSTESWKASREDIASMFGDAILVN